MSTTRPRICIVGAGAIGGYFAARLAQAGNEVSALARGKTLDALRRHGMRFEAAEERIAPMIKASDQTSELGVQDIVILAVKAPSLPIVAQSMSPLLGPDTLVVPVLNGLPWWFFLESGQPLEGLRLRSVDANGDIEAHIPMQNVVGGVVFASCSTPEPGLVRHASGNQVVFGEPRGGSSPRVTQLAALFEQAGFQSVASPHIRTDIWAKLLGNACFNPSSLLTGTATDIMIDDPRLHAMFVNMMDEALALGGQLGTAPAVKALDRIAFTRKMGNVKTSMLQDVEAGRPVEIDAILGALVECAHAAGVSVPTLSTVYALARMRAQTLGLYPA